ncbi:MAG TPA: ATP-binding protein [Thiolinea sp.]|nr:ATP-binding protein [Thiolinea sp.]
MKGSVFRKLITAFLGLTLIILIATLGLARWSFEHGFLDYVNALEQSRLEQVSSALAEAYASYGSWEAIATEHLNRILYSRPPDEGGPPPEHGGRKPRPELRSGKPPGPDHRQRRRRGPPTALLDQNGLLIAGHPDAIRPEHGIRVAVQVDGQTVGAVVGLPRRYFESPQETAFSHQQWLTSLLIGLASLLLALLASWVLARWLLGPLRRMVAAIRTLSGGDFSPRLQTTSDDELARLAADINHLAATLEDNQAARRRWLADISHELRTPVTILSGELEALQDGIRPFNREQLDSLSQEVARLQRLIEDLYQLSLSELGGLHYSFSPLYLDQLLEQLVTGLQPRAQAAGLSLNLETGPGRVMADRHRMEQLVTNLLSNALAYTDTPGRVEIELYRARGQVIVIVEDSPPGVPADECRKLFDPLYRREESRNRRLGGAGLGLAICSNIAHAHRGSISARPSRLGGLCVELRLPEYHEGEE